MGRPVGITPEIQKRLVLSLKIGNYRETAAAEAGVSPRTFREWMRRGARAKKGVYYDLHQAVLIAEAEAEGSAVQTIRKASREGDWRAAESYLERKFPKRWSRHINLTLGEELQKLLKVAERVLDDDNFGKLLEAITSEGRDDDSEG
ncbi:MAG: hypothetical protein AMXMBFR56_65610 [Polyangiaceae bacterium]